MTITSMMCMKYMKFMKNGHQNPCRIHTNYCMKIKLIIQRQYSFIELCVVDRWELLISTES